MKNNIFRLSLFFPLIFIQATYSGEPENQQNQVNLKGQESLQEEAGPQNIETIIVTANRNTQSLQELAGNTAIISNDALTLLNHAHIQESLARVPGANIARGNGQEYLPAIRSPILTGAGACGSVMASIDGIPLRAAGFCNINELFDAPTEIAERIEVIRGPGSVMFGSNAVHGVINIITPKVSEMPETRLGISVGPHDYSRLKSTVSRQLKNQGVRADISLDHDGGYRDDSGFDQQKIHLRHELESDWADLITTLSFSNLNQETAGYVAGFKAYRDNQLKDTNPNPEAYRDAQSARLATQLHLPTDSDDRFVITPYLRYTHMSFLQHFLPGNPVEENGHKSFGLQSTYFTSASETLKFTAGIDLEYSAGFLKQYQDAPTQGSAFLQATIPPGKHYDYQVDATMFSPFLQTHWQLTADFSVTAGLRYETMYYHYDNNMLAGRTDENGNTCGFGGCRYSRPPDGEDRFENFSPKLGLLYKLNEHQQLYLTLASGFRAPQITELYRLQREQLQVNLDSEQINSLELGFRNQSQNFDSELILFAMKKQNVIYRDADFFNVPNGKSRHLGMEFSAGFNFNSQWRLAISGSYAKHQYANDWSLGTVNINNNDVDSAPRHFGSAQLQWRFQPESLAELEWLHLGSYYTDPENLHSYEGHDIFNLRISWQINNRWNINTRITNLTDREYAERADYTSFSGERYFPGEPRALYLSIETQW